LAKAAIEGDKLVITMGGLERVQTSTRRYEVPLRNVIDVDTGHAQTAFAGSFSTSTGFGFGAGAKMPILPFGGRISTGGERLLVAFRDPDRCITISLRDDAYDKIIIQVDDKERVANEIRSAKSPKG
jgi:hypothetical protein